MTKTSKNIIITFLIGILVFVIGNAFSDGFDFKDFQLADRNELIAQYPKYKEIIFNLTIA